MSIYCLGIFMKQYGYQVSDTDIQSPEKKLFFNEIHHEDFFIKKVLYEVSGKARKSIFYVTGIFLERSLKDVRTI